MAALTISFAGRVIVYTSVNLTITHWRLFSYQQEVTSYGQAISKLNNLIGRVFAGKEKERGVRPPSRGVKHLIEICSKCCCLRSASYFFLSKPPSRAIRSTMESSTKVSR